MDAVEELVKCNRGKRGGWTVQIPTPTPEEIREETARIRASWADPRLRLEMGLPPDKPED